MTIDRDEKRLHVQLWAESGMSKRAYARENGINRNTFYGWCNKEEGEGLEDKQLVEVLFDRTPKRTSKDRTGNITLQTPKGYHLHITGSFEKKLLQELLDVLEAR